MCAVYILLHVSIVRLAEEGFFLERASPKALSMKSSIIVATQGIYNVSLGLLYLKRCQCIVHGLIIGNLSLNTLFISRARFICCREINGGRRGLTGNES